MVQVAHSSGKEMKMYKSRKLPTLQVGNEKNTSTHSSDMRFQKYKFRKLLTLQATVKPRKNTKSRRSAEIPIVVREKYVGKYSGK